MTLYYSINYQDASNVIYPHKTHMIEEAIKKDHIMSKMHQNWRCKENFEASDLLWADIDNAESDNPAEWITIDKFIEIFSDIAFSLATSRNHMIDKTDNDIVVCARPRFHVYFPINLITQSAKHQNYLNQLGRLYPFFDKKALESSRCFFGNDHAEVYHNDGTSILTRLEAQEINVSLADTRIGERNDALFSLGSKLVNTIPIEQIEPILQQANSTLDDPLPVSEVKTIANSVGRYMEPQSTLKVIKNYHMVKTHISDPDGGVKVKYVIESELDYTPEMIEPMHLFSSFSDGSGKKFLFLTDGNDTFLNDPKDLHFILNKHGYALDFTKGKEITESKLLTYYREKSKTYQRLTCLPEIDMQDDTLYRGSHIEPKNTGVLLDLLNTLTFESEKDRYRFCSGLLSGFLNSSFDGEKPLLAVTADTQNSGKSDAVRKSCNVETGLNPIECNATDKDEKQFSGISAFANPNVLFDNVKDFSKEQLLNMTQRITDKYIPSHVMYLSHSRIRNNKTYWTTFTTEQSVNSDVLNRCVIIKMKDGRTISNKIKSEISIKLGDLEHKQTELVADVLWYFSQVSFNEKYPCKAHPKHARWSYYMANILHVIFPDIQEFDFSLSAEDEEYADDRMYVEEFLDDVLGGEKNIFIPIADLVDTWREKNKSANTTASSLTRRLKNIKPSLRRFQLEYTTDANKRGWKIDRVC